MSEATTTDTATETQTTSSTTSSDPAATTSADLPFYEAFAREDLKTSPSIQRYKTPEDLAGAYVALEKRYGVDPALRVDLPKDLGDKEAMKAVWQRLGAPDKPEGYELKLPDGARAEDVALVTDFTKLAADIGMPKSHAGPLLEWFQAKGAEAVKAQEAAFEEARAAGEATLKKEWGEAFDHRSKEIGRLLAAHNDPELTAALDGKLGNYPGLARFIGKMLDRMAEPEAAGGRSGDGAEMARALTPAQAMGAARELEKHPALQDKKHPQHKEIVARRAELLRQAA